MPAFTLTRSVGTSRSTQQGKSIRSRRIIISSERKELFSGEVHDCGNTVKILERTIDGFLEYKLFVPFYIAWQALLECSLDVPLCAGLEQRRQSDSSEPSTVPGHMRLVRKALKFQNPSQVVRSQ